MKTSALKIVSLLFLTAVFCLTQWKECAQAAPIPGIDITYTTDADFDKGTLMNLDHKTVHDQLQLSDTTTPFPFINIALSAKGTIVRIDVNSGVILGEYFTAPGNMQRDPSRTTVDQSGNVWVSNRAESGTSGGVSKGSITRVGLIIGGTRVNADGTVNPTGQFLKPPFQYNTCIDRNKDGLIKTSRGADNILSWSNAGNVDSNGGVSTADDECIINYTRVVATNTRTVAIDANNDIWVGGANTAHEKVNGLTGQPVPGTQFNLGCGGYGGLIDKNGVLWSTRFGSGLLRYDTKTKTGACLGTGKGDYGIGVDPNTGEIWHVFYSGGSIAKLDSNGKLLGTYSHGDSYAQGVVVDKSGNVWVAHSTARSSVGHLRTNGTFVGNVSTDSGPTGVAVDANGKVWSANYGASTANRIDPNAGATGGGGFKVGAVDKQVKFSTNSYPYNYSDMTGYVAIGGTSPQGSWSAVQDSGVAGNKWGTITWNKESQGIMPAGSIILVEARTSDSEAGLSGKGFTAVSNNQPFSLIGRFIEVRVTMKPNSAGDKPVLSDLRISMTPMSNVRVIDTISSGNIVINTGSFATQPYSITNGTDTSVIEWRFDSFTIGQINDLSYTVAMKNPIPGEDRLVSHKLEVLYTDINGNPVRNEIGPQSVHVLNSKYAASLMLNKQSFGAKENALISAGITNLSLFARTLDAKITIEDSGGAIVQEVTTLPGLQFATGETKNFSNLVFNTGTSSPGDYSARIRLYEGQSQVGTASAGFKIAPDIAAGSSVATDKVAYQPNEQATVTATVKSLSQNFVMENLSAKVTIKDPTGNVQLFTVTNIIPTLMPGASSAFKSYWNAGTNPAGTYAVRLQVMNGTTELSTATTQFQILSSSPTGAGLKGTITASQNPIYWGKDEVLTYNVTNTGNEDLTAITLNVIVANPDTQQIVQNYSKLVTLPQKGSVSDTITVPTTPLPIRAYVAVLQFTSPTVTQPKTLSGATFVVKDSIPPSTAITVGSPKYEASGKLYVSDVTVFTLTATDDFSGVAKTEYRIDEGSWTSYTPFSIPTEGTHVIGFRSTDNAENIETEKSVTVIVDKTAPVSLITVDSPRYAANGKLYISGKTGIIISATDNSSGVKVSEYSIDGAPFVTYSAPITLAALPEGSHTIDCRSTDNVGKMAQAQQLTVILDKAPPKTAITATDPLAQGAANTVSPATAFTLSATDDLSGVKSIWYRIDEGQWQLYTAAFTLTGIKAGSHTISFNAVDNVENDEPEQTVTVGLIVFETKKWIDTDPVVLLPPLKDCDWDDWCWNKKKDKVDPLAVILKSLGVSYYVAKDREDFERALRSGRYNIYLITDDRAEYAEDEIREGVYYGDGIIYIKTGPEEEHDMADMFGVRLTGKSTNQNLIVTLEESPLSPAATLRTKGKTVITTITSTTAKALGTVRDKHCQFPAVVYNEYGRGGTLLFTFDLVDSPDTTKVADLLLGAIRLVNPKQHALRAQESVPIKIEVNNSAAPFDLEVDETIPAESTADTIIPGGTLAGSIITWRQSLGDSEKAKFGYYLNLPDKKGDYTATTVTKYSDNGDYRPYETLDLTLKVDACSSELLQTVISELVSHATSGREDRKRIAEALCELHHIREIATDREAAEENIEKIIEAAEEVKKLTVDASQIRIQLDELLKIWQRKWYLLKERKRKDKMED